MFEILAELFMLLFIAFCLYILSIFIITSLQSSLVIRFNSCYAGKSYMFGFPTEYKELLKRNNNYIEWMAFLMPYLDFKDFYIKS